MLLCLLIILHLLKSSLFMDLQDPVSALASNFFPPPPITLDLKALLPLSPWIWCVGRLFFLIGGIPKFEDSHDLTYLRQVLPPCERLSHFWSFPSRCPLVFRPDAGPAFRGPPPAPSDQDGVAPVILGALPAQLILFPRLRAFPLSLF